MDRLKRQIHLSAPVVRFLKVFFPRFLDHDLQFLCYLSVNCFLDLLFSHFLRRHCTPSFWPLGVTLLVKNKDFIPDKLYYSTKEIGTNDMFLEWVLLVTIGCY